MMTKHTPGPWEVGSDPVWVYLGPAGGETPLIRCLSVESDVADETDYANARLIAAAPDLLEALKDAVCLNSCGLYAPIPEHWSDQTKSVILAARAAIAKAEGKP